MTKDTTRKAHLEPAHSIVRRLGGEAKVAEIVGLSKVQVWRWQVESEKGGTGGTIPARHQNRIIAYARTHGLPITPADFFGSTSELVA